jgi:hypothetical protein
MVGIMIPPLPTAKVEQVKFDAMSMHVQPQVAAQQKIVDDGSGEVQVCEEWRPMLGGEGVVKTSLDLTLT